MVLDKEVISNIFQELLSDYSVKCGPSISQMKTTLNKMSQDEKIVSLDGLLNPAEREHYNMLSDKVKSLDDTIREHEDFLTDGKHMGMEPLIENLIKGFKRNRDNIIESMFIYDRRIIEGYEHGDGNVPSVNINDYAVDNSITSNELGNIEQTLIDKQSNIQFTKNNLNSLEDYFQAGYLLLNSRLNNGETWNRLNNREKNAHDTRLNKMEKELTDAINRTDSLGMKLQVFHGGTFDVTKNVGDKVKFKGYLSTSLQKNVAEEWMDGKFTEDGTPAYTYQILINEKTKGVMANDNHGKSLTTHRVEHELLLDKGFEGTIVNVDVGNHIVTLLQD